MNNASLSGSEAVTMSGGFKAPVPASGLFVVVCILGILAGGGRKTIGCGPPIEEYFDLVL